MLPIAWIDPVNRDAFFMKMAAEALAARHPLTQVFTTERQGVELADVPVRPFFDHVSRVPIGRLGLGTRARMIVTTPPNFRRVAGAMPDGASVLYSSELPAIVESGGLRRLRARGSRMTRLVHNLGGRRRAWFGANVDLFDRVVFLSEAVRTEAVTSGVIELDRTRVLCHPHFGSLMENVEVDRAVAADIRAAAAGRHVLAYISRPSVAHGIDLFYDLLAEATRLDLRVCGVVLGRPDGGWDAAQDRAARTSRSVNNSIAFSHLGPYEFSTLKAVMEVADAAVAPYREISQSGAIAMALGEGVPVLASRVGSNSELVRDGVDGRLYDPGVPDEVTEVLESLFVGGPGPRTRFEPGAIGSHLDPGAWAAALEGVLTD